MPKANRTGDVKREWEWDRGWEREREIEFSFGEESNCECERVNERKIERESVTWLNNTKLRSATYTFIFSPYRFLIPHCILLTLTSLAQRWKANCFLVEDYVTHPSYPNPYNLSILPQGGLMMLLHLLSWAEETLRLKTGNWWTKESVELWWDLDLAPDLVLTGMYT